MKYAQAFDIASVAVQARERGSVRYCPGVEREAALAAVPQSNDEAVITAIAETLSRHEYDLRCCI